MTDFAKVRAILDAATPGPWTRVGQIVDAGAHRIADTQDVCCFGHSGQECTDDEMETWALADARAIVVARNLAPELLAVAEAASDYQALRDITTTRLDAALDALDAKMKETLT